MSEKIDKKEFDEKVTKVMKYGIAMGLLIGAVVAALEQLTGAGGKIAEYSIVILSISGFVVFLVFVVYAAVQLRFKKVRKD